MIHDDRYVGNDEISNDPAIVGKSDGAGLFFFLIIIAVVVMAFLIHSCSAQEITAAKADAGNTHAAVTESSQDISVNGKVEDDHSVVYGSTGNAVVQSGLLTTVSDGGTCAPAGVVDNTDGRPLAPTDHCNTSELTYTACRAVAEDLYMSDYYYSEQDKKKFDFSKEQKMATNRFDLCVNAYKNLEYAPYYNADLAKLELQAMSHGLVVYPNLVPTGGISLITPIPGHYTLIITTMVHGGKPNVVGISMSMSPVVTKVDDFTSMARCHAGADAAVAQGAVKTMCIKVN